MAGPQIRTLVPSAAYSASQATQEQAVDPNCRALLVYLNLTVRAAAETIVVSIQVKGPVSGTWQDLVAYTATGAVGEYIKVAGLLPVTTGFAANVEAKQSPIPTRYRIGLVHSGGGAHTYSVATEELY